MTDLPPPGPDCAACAARDEVIAAQGGQLAAQREQIEGLRAKMARLERALSRNSSMPPSADDLPGRKPPSRQQRRAAERAVRKRGKQPGAPGAAMTWAEPDEVRDYYPAGACGCGADLAAAVDLGVARSYQQAEIPAPAARRIQHDLRAARCACGREHVAARPPGMPDSPVSIGPGLRALAVYLLVFQHVPVERCRQLIADATGAEVSAGFVHACPARAAETIGGVVKLIKALITAAQVAGFDETTLRAGPAGGRALRAGGVHRGVLGAVPGRADPWNRSASSASSRTSPGVVVPDRYVNCFHDGWKHIAGHQARCAHLLRDFEDAAGLALSPVPSGWWPVG